jgi:hypothetical protein
MVPDLCSWSNGVPSFRTLLSLRSSAVGTFAWSAAASADKVVSFSLRRAGRRLKCVGAASGQVTTVYRVKCPTVRIRLLLAVQLAAEQTIWGKFHLKNIVKCLSFT